MLAFFLPGLAVGSEPQIVVDGVVDAAYGPPLAVDGTGDGNGNRAMDLWDLYVAEDGDYLHFAFRVNAEVTDSDHSWGVYALYIDVTGDEAGADHDALGRNVKVNYPHRPEYALYLSMDDPPVSPHPAVLYAWQAGQWGVLASLEEVALGVVGGVSTFELRVARSHLGSPARLWCEVWSTGHSSGLNAQDTINAPAEDWNAADWWSTASLSVSTEYPVPPATVTPTPGPFPSATPPVAATPTPTVTPTPRPSPTPTPRPGAVFLPLVDRRTQ